MVFAGVTTRPRKRSTEEETRSSARALHSPHGQCVCAHVSKNGTWGSCNGIWTRRPPALLPWSSAVWLCNFSCHQISVEGATLWVIARALRGNSRSYQSVWEFMVRRHIQTMGAPSSTLHPARRSVLWKVLNDIPQWLRDAVNTRNVNDVTSVDITCAVILDMCSHKSLYVSCLLMFLKTVFCIV